MVRIRTSLGAEFNQLRGQVLTDNKSFSGTKTTTKKTPKKEKITWKEKFADIAKYEDKISSLDFLNLFTYKRIEISKPYYPNKGRDLKAFKTAIERYGVVDTYNALRFVFESEQSYIDTSVTRPTLFMSSYMDTILRDSALWLEGKYTNKKHQQKVTREWTDDKREGAVASVGVWE